MVYEATVLCINIASVLSSNVEHNTMLMLAVVSSFIACAIAKIAYSGLVKQCAKKHCTTELTESETNEDFEGNSYITDTGASGGQRCWSAH